MSKANITKADIIAKSAELFNQKGFAGVSMADIMAATGLQKGGIYNHFASKEEIAIAAFDYAFSQVQQRYRKALRASPRSLDRLLHFIDLFRENYNNPAVKGGCPIMNTAIDQDWGQAVLRDRAKQAMNDWREMLCKVIARGISKQEIQPTVHPDEVATLMIMTLEGGLMMSQLYNDRTFLDRATEHLKLHLMREIAL
jgi:TetR/AcrR family transcriptional regulator, transcriptional repressor for nem operon